MLTRAELLVAGAAAAVSRQARPLREWQAKRVAVGYAATEGRPGYRVVKLRRLSPARFEVTGNEPGYLDGQQDVLEPDVTVTLVERRGVEFWLRDPFTRSWARWL